MSKFSVLHKITAFLRSHHILLEIYYIYMYMYMLHACYMLNNKVAVNRQSDQVKGERDNPTGKSINFDDNLKHT